MSDTRSHVAKHIQAGHTLVLSIALASFTAPVNAQHYVVEWPEARQHLLEGHYTGNVRNTSRKHPDCEFQRAELLIQRNRRYSISLRCDDDASLTRTIQGRWWIDEIAGSCLILIGPDASSTDHDHRYGFRIHGIARELHQDGGGCQSADDRDAGMILVRQDRRKDN